MKNYSNEKLNKLVNRINYKYFKQNIQCYVRYNNRLRTTLGRFLVRQDKSLSRKLHSKRQQIDLKIESMHNNNKINNITRNFNKIFTHSYLPFSCIEINPKIITKKYFGTRSKAELIDVIKHELCHYNLFLQGLPCGHNKKFYKLTHKIHCRSSRLAPCPFKLALRLNYINIYTYKCSECGAEISTCHKLKSLYVHYKDLGVLKLIGVSKIPKQIYNFINRIRKN